MYKVTGTKIIVIEQAGRKRTQEPVTVGIPFPNSLLSDKDRLSLVDNENNPIPLQAETLAKWPDRSIKWILLDFMADCLGHSAKCYYLNIGDQVIQQVSNGKIEISDNKSTLDINTGKSVFTLDKMVFLPFKNVVIAGSEVIENQKSRMTLKDKDGKVFSPVVKNAVIETNGPIRSTIKLEGDFETGEGDPLCSFFSRITFHAGRSMVRIDFTIRNPKAARHPGGLWDLGDPGSIFFKDLSMHITLKTTSDTDIMWKTKLNASFNSMNSTNSKKLIIYQDSSGGDNWDSPAHVNRDGKVMNSFRGFIVRDEKIIEKGDRATPEIMINSDGKTIAASIQNFWQNCPKSIEAEDNALRLRLFPEQYKDVFELQGGEQKTHTLYIRCESAADQPMNLDWVHSPLAARVAPEWYAESRAIGYMAPVSNDKNPDYQKLVDNLIKGENTFFHLREKADEYGWRNFGDVYAEHEIVGYKGSLFPFVSHYNNQYDVINGCILQYARTGHLTWYRLMNDLAGHVIDIDIYHTKKDRPAFNGGMFWHTDHFMHAETSTHRSFSRINMEKNGMKYYGGGLSPEHCYTTGLCKYYYLTGEVIAKDAVIEVAEWIMNVDNLEKSLFGVLRKARRIVNSFRNEYSNAPGRSQANSLNTLLDAFELTGEKRYIDQAEKLIRKYISPTDDIDKLNKQQIELRWFYLIFLQSVGKYLDIKDGIAERDEMFSYAKESLLYHAEWMLENEAPYKEMFHIVEIPSSTWSAQDIRKSAIFDYAYKYSDEDHKAAFREKAEFFYNSSINDVLSFKDGSATFVRPLAVLMHYGVMHTYFQNLG